MRATSGEGVEALVDLAPALPQPFTLLTHGRPAEHLAPDPTGELDDRLRWCLFIDHGTGVT